MYPPILPPCPAAPSGYPARNSFALLVCSAFLIAVCASKGLGLVITAMLGVALLTLIGLVFTVIALAKGGIAGGVLLLLGWVVFLPFWSLGGLNYGAQVSARRPPQPITADASAWTNWINGVELGYQRAVAQHEAARRSAALTVSTPTVAAPTVDSQPVKRADQDFAAAVEDSKRRAIRRYPDLAVAGSAFNRAFVIEYNRLASQHSSDLLLVTWPETLAEECARKNARVSRR